MLINKCSLGYHDLRVFQEGGGPTFGEGAFIRRNTETILSFKLAVIELFKYHYN